jgi:hypothetical protein
LGDANNFSSSPANIFDSYENEGRQSASRICKTKYGF